MLKQFWANPKFRRDTVLVLAIGTLLAFMSPFGATSHLPFWGAWVYWAGLLLWGWIAAVFLEPLFVRFFAPLPPLANYALISVCIALIVMPAILGVQWLLAAPIHIPYWPNLLFFIWIISAAITGVNFLVDQAFDEKARSDGSAFLTRIPAKISGGPLYAITSEDHYLRIITDRGSDLILMRLADAVGELEGFDGMQVHRSWWVARQGVDAIKRDQARIFLILRDGSEVPVSRTYATKIREAGWLG